MNVPPMTCREAARLLFGAADRPLTAAERDVLQAHIAECEACERVQGQVQLMQRASAAWRAYRQAQAEEAAPAEGDKPAQQK